jgi:hypothetical protein
LGHDHIQKALGSNIRRETGYPNTPSMDFLRSFRQMRNYYVKLGQDHIQKALGSNIRRETGYPNTPSMDFLRSSRQMRN